MKYEEPHDFLWRAHILITLIWRCGLQWNIVLPY